MADEAELTRLTFAALKPTCQQVMQLASIVLQGDGAVQRLRADEAIAPLTALEAALRCTRLDGSEPSSAPALYRAGLPRCIDYVLLPLLLMLPHGESALPERLQEGAWRCVGALVRAAGGSAFCADSGGVWTEASPVARSEDVLRRCVEALRGGSGEEGARAVMYVVRLLCGHAAGVEEGGEWFGARTGGRGAPFETCPPPPFDSAPSPPLAAALSALLTIAHGGAGLTHCRAARVEALATVAALLLAVSRPPCGPSALSPVLPGLLTALASLSVPSALGGRDSHVREGSVRVLTLALAYGLDGTPSPAAPRVMPLLRAVAAATLRLPPAPTPCLERGAHVALYASLLSSCAASLPDALPLAMDMLVLCGQSECGAMRCTLAAQHTSHLPDLLWGPPPLAHTQEEGLRLVAAYAEVEGGALLAGAELWAAAAVPALPLSLLAADVSDESGPLLPFLVTLVGEHALEAGLGSSGVSPFPHPRPPPSPNRAAPYAPSPAGGPPALLLLGGGDERGILDPPPSPLSLLSPPLLLLLQGAALRGTDITTTLVNLTSTPHMRIKGAWLLSHALAGAGAAHRVRAARLLACARGGEGDAPALGRAARSSGLALASSARACVTLGRALIEGALERGFHGEGVEGCRLLTAARAALGRAFAPLLPSCMPALARALLHSAPGQLGEAAAACLHELGRAREGGEEEEAAVRLLGIPVPLVAEGRGGEAGTALALPPSSHGTLALLSTPALALLSSSSSTLAEEAVRGLRWVAAWGPDGHDLLPWGRVPTLCPPSPSSLPPLLTLLATATLAAHTDSLAPCRAGALIPAASSPALPLLLDATSALLQAVDALARRGGETDLLVELVEAGGALVAAAAVCGGRQGGGSVAWVDGGERTPALPTLLDRVEARAMTEGEYGPSTLARAPPAATPFPSTSAVRSGLAASPLLSPAALILAVRLVRMAAAHMNAAAADLARDDGGRVLSHPTPLLARLRLTRACMRTYAAGVLALTRHPDTLHPLVSDTWPSLVALLPPPGAVRLLSASHSVAPLSALAEELVGAEGGRKRGAQPSSTHTLSVLNQATPLMSTVDVARAFLRRRAAALAGADPQPGAKGSTQPTALRLGLAGAQPRVSPSWGVVDGPSARGGEGDGGGVDSLTALVHGAALATAMLLARAPTQGPEGHVPGAACGDVLAPKFAADVWPRLRALLLAACLEGWGSGSGPLHPRHLLLLAGLRAVGAFASATVSLARSVDVDAGHAAQVAAGHAGDALSDRGPPTPGLKKGGLLRPPVLGSRRGLYGAAEEEAGMPEDGGSTAAGGDRTRVAWESPLLRSSAAWEAAVLLCTLLRPPPRPQPPALLLAAAREALNAIELAEAGTAAAARAAVGGA